MTFSKPAKLLQCYESHFDKLRIVRNITHVILHYYTTPSASHQTFEITAKCLAGFSRHIYRSHFIFISFVNAVGKMFAALQIFGLEIHFSISRLRAPKFCNLQVFQQLIQS